MLVIFQADRIKGCMYINNYIAGTISENTPYFWDNKRNTPYFFHRPYNTVVRRFETKVFDSLGSKGRAN